MDWAGVAVMKKAYRIYCERGYRLRLLSAAFRHHRHWSEFIGGNVVISPPWQWQKRFNASDVTVENRMDKPVDPKIIAELEKKFVDFRRAYDENGMKVEEFDGFGATVRTLRQFCQATSDLIANNTGYDAVLKTVSMNRDKKCPLLAKSSPDKEIYQSITP